MQLSVKVDIKQVTRYLLNVQKRQVPFAVAGALNDTAFAARKAERTQIVKKLDRPKPFTINGFRVTKATKTKLVSSVFVTDSVWSYLRWQVQGGARRPAKRFNPVPVQARLDKYGNIRGRKRGPRSKRQYIDRKNGVLGVWERGKSGRSKLIIFYSDDAAQYDKRFPFFKIARGVGRSKFPTFFAKRMRKALATAR